MTTLNYDTGGFIVGVNKMKDGIDNVHDDTQEIIQILKSQNQIGNTRMRELTRAVKSANYRSESQASASTSRTRASSHDRRPRISSSSSTDSANNPNSDRASNRSTVSRNSLGAADRGTNSSGASDSRTRSSDRSSSNTHRERDANGRFISDGSNSANVSRSSNRGFGGGINGGLGHSDVSGMDPVLDSLKEAKDLLSPIGRAGKLAGRVTKFSWSKFKSMKRREPLSNDETRHNRENEKLLDKIWKAIRKQGGRGGNAGRGLLGGLLSGAAAGGGLLRKLGKMKFLGPLAALAGAGSLTMDWDNLDHKGKSEGVGSLAGAGVGGLAGMKLGAMVGAIGGPVGMAIGGAVGGIAGAWLGSKGGEALGAAASPYIEDWTKAITAYNLPKKMGDTWDDGIKPFFTKLDSVADKINSWIEDKVSSVVDFVSPVDAGDVSAGVTVKANKAADIITKNALTRSSGYCARYVREGLQQAGYDLKTMGDAKNYNNGAMQDAGFSVIDSQSAPQKGDVMVMPAQGGHGAGHMQIYNGQQWVSDFKQKSKNPWNDVATENLQYTMYRDQRGAMVPGTATNMAGQTKGSRAKSDQLMSYFISQGWTREQAAGLVGNLQKESGGFRDDVIRGDKSGRGDGGKAVGIAQWHLERQQDFKDKYGKSIVGTTLMEQAAFVHHELTKGKEQAAGNKLRQTRTAAQAGAVVSEHYERPAAVEAEKRERARIAEAINKNYAITSNKTPAPKSGNGILGVSVNDINKVTAPKITKSSSGTPLKSHLGYEPANLPALPVLKIPAAPKIKERLDSGGSNKPVILQSSNDTINQNLSDRGLAHAVTGGFGQDRYWG